MEGNRTWKEMARRQRGALESEVVAVLVEHGDAMTPGQVRDALDADLAYTTMMTTLARLSEKGVVTRRRAGAGLCLSSRGR